MEEMNNKNQGKDPSTKSKSCHSDTFLVVWSVFEQNSFNQISML